MERGNDMKLMVYNIDVSDAVEYLIAVRIYTLSESFLYFWRDGSRSAKSTGERNHCVLFYLKFLGDRDTGLIRDMKN